MSTGPDDECGITVAIDTVLARSPLSALVVRSVIAYTDGVVLVIGVHSRTPLGDHWTDVLTDRHPGNLAVAYGFGIHGNPQLLAPILLPISTSDTTRETRTGAGGDGDTGRYDVGMWISPRRETPFQIGATWLDGALDLTEIEFDMPSNDECQQRIVQLWS